MPNDHGVRVQETNPGCWDVLLNGERLASWMSKDKANLRAAAIRKAIEAAREQALDEAIGLYVSGGNPDVWLCKLEQLKERNND